MLHTLRLKPGDLVLDLGCGKGATSIFLAKHCGVKVISLDLWTSADFLEHKFSAQGFADHISAIQMDATQVPNLFRAFIEQRLACWIHNW